MKLFLTLCLSLSLSSGLTSQTSRTNVYEMASRTEGYSYSQLIDFAEDNLSEKESISLFFYYWIAQHIAYDYSISLADISSSRLAAESVQSLSVFESRKATCLGFTNLYNSFLQNFDIDHRLVLGYSRSPMNVLEGVEPQEDHAWSAISFDNRWYLVEVTWANKYINDPKARDYYFKTDPSEMILEHFPKDEKWQLLDDKWSFDRFVKAPLIDPWYLSRSIPGEQMIKTGKNEKGELIITCIRPPKWRLSLRAINKYDQDQKSLKYKVSRSRKTIQFTIKKYDGKSPLRLDASKVGVYSSVLKAPGLAYLIDINQD